MSHLTDLQIIEIDSQHPHLQSCLRCKQKWVHQQNMKQQLVDAINAETEQFIDTHESIPDWDAFSHTILSKDKQIESPSSKIVPFIRYQSSLFTRRAALGLAASFLLVTLFLQTTSNQDVVSQDQETAQLIEQNSQLQYQWQERQKALWDTEQASSDEINQSHQQLLLLDDEIQKAYLAKLDKQTIKHLWQKRKFEMERLIAMPSDFSGPKPTQRSSRTLNI